MVRGSGANAVEIELARGVRFDVQAVAAGPAELDVERRIDVPVVRDPGIDDAHPDCAGEDLREGSIESEGGDGDMRRVEDVGRLSRDVLGRLRSRVGGALAAGLQVGVLARRTCLDSPGRRVGNARKWG